MTDSDSTRARAAAKAKRPHKISTGIEGLDRILGVSRKLADLLGGELIVESELGAGSTFTLRLPRSSGSA